MCFLFFFFNDTATTEIYTLSLHDALPICGTRRTAARHSSLVRKAMSVALVVLLLGLLVAGISAAVGVAAATVSQRSEEHTSELQSQSNLVCRLLLEKKQTRVDQRRLFDLR